MQNQFCYRASVTIFWVVPYFFLTIKPFVFFFRSNTCSVIKKPWNTSVHSITTQCNIKESIKEASEEISSEDAVASSHWWRMAHNARTKCRRHEFIYQINKGDKRKTYIYWLSGCPGGDAKLVTLTTSHRHKEKKINQFEKSYLHKCLDHLSFVRAEDSIQRTCACVYFRSRKTKHLFIGGMYNRWHSC